MKKKRVKLGPVLNSCQSVKLPRATGYDNPIGTICQRPHGWMYHSFPVPHVERGPKRTKAAAILAVVRDYKTWIG